MSYYKSAGDGPVVVQGHDVRGSSGAFSQALSTAQTHNMSSSLTSNAAQHQTAEPPNRGCRDAAFAALFYIHVALIGWAASVNTPIMVQEIGEGVVNHMDYWDNGDGGRRFFRRFLNEEQGEEQGDQGGDQEQDNGKEEGVDIDFDTTHLVMIVVFATLLAFAVSSLALGFMIACAQPLIKTALIFNVAFFGLLMILSFAGGSTGAGVVFLLLFLFSGYYAYRVWARIPFAASNLVTAVTAVRANMGLAVYAYWSVIVLFLWSLVWALSSASTIFVKAECNADGECDGSVSGFLVFLFLLSYYWTSQVISNVVHVTTAGTVGSWWFHPNEAQSCCSKAVRESYGRSLTTSFGSICLGSLLVAIVQSIKEMINSMRDGEDSVLACVAVCLLGCIENLIEYFNKWAFVYVGLYGFSFMEAGTNAMNLFRARGWTAIIADVMIDTVLFMLSLGVALLVAILSLLIGSTMQVDDASTMFAAFILGGLIGYGVCATLFSLVSSGVNTVIVCYAEAPNEFQANHPELSERMRESWRAAWPSDFKY